MEPFDVLRIFRNPIPFACAGIVRSPHALPVPPCSACAFYQPQCQYTKLDSKDLVRLFLQKLLTEP